MGVWTRTDLDARFADPAHSVQCRRCDTWDGCECPEGDEDVVVELAVSEP